MDPVWIALTGTILGALFLHGLESLLAVPLDIRHNSFDLHCVNWIGDRNPDKNDTKNRWFGGKPKELDLRRCVVCRPYTETEADELLDTLVNV